MPANADKTSTTIKKEKNGIKNLSKKYSYMTLFTYIILRFTSKNCLINLWHG